MKIPETATLLRLLAKLCWETQGSQAAIDALRLVLSSLEEHRTVSAALDLRRMAYGHLDALENARNSADRNDALAYTAYVCAQLERTLDPPDPFATGVH